MLEHLSKIIGSEEWAKTARPLAELPAKVYDDISSFLGKVCGPPGEELGLLFKDRVKCWRMMNLIRILQKVEEKIGPENLGKEKVNLRFLATASEPASFCDDETLQDMWAGLIANSRSASEKDDRNLLFIDTIKSLTSSQARVLKFIYSQLPSKIKHHLSCEENELSDDFFFRPKYRIEHLISELVDLLPDHNPTVGKSNSTDKAPSPTDFGKLPMILVELDNLRQKNLLADICISIRELRTSPFDLKLITTITNFGIAFYGACTGDIKLALRFRYIAKDVPAEVTFLLSANLVEEIFVDPGRI